MEARSVQFDPVPIVLRVHCRCTKEQERAMYLSGRETWQQQLAYAYMGRLKDLFHPITLSDRSYWRNGRWNTPSK